MLQLNMKGASALGIAILVGSYAVHRRDESRLHTLLTEKTPLSSRLAGLPLSMGHWAGEDVPMPQKIIEVAAADDFIKRRYRNLYTGNVIDLYVSYYGNRRAMVGHHPERCLRAFGWKPAMAPKTVEFGGAEAGARAWSGRVFWYKNEGNTLTVVTLYNVCGDWTADRHAAERASHRWASPDRAHYLLQVQISVQGTRSVDDMRRMLDDFLPAFLPFVEQHLPTSPRTQAEAPQE